MIELDVQARRKSVVVDDDPPSNYLVLGDFGGRAAAAMAIDRDNFDGVLSRMVRKPGCARHLRSPLACEPNSLFRTGSVIAVCLAFDDEPRAH